MYSVTGGAAPPDYFAPGTSGFTVPEAEFTLNGSLTGVWIFLGQSVNVTSDLKMCADSGMPGQCSVMTQAQLKVPLDYTRSVVVRLTKMATAMAKKGMLKGAQGSYSTVLLGRGASTIAAMQQMLAPTMKGVTYTCPSDPGASCTLVSLNNFKSVAQRNFSRIFAKPVPKGFESIAKMGPQEIRAFKANVLDKLPNQVWVCPANVTPAAY
jgi:hypothetical protein